MLDAGDSKYLDSRLVLLLSVIMFMMLLLWCCVCWRDNVDLCCAVFGVIWVQRLDDDDNDIHFDVGVCFMSVILCGRNYLLYEYSHKALVIRNTSTKNANLLCILLVLHNTLPTRESITSSTRQQRNLWRRWETK